MRRLLEYGWDREAPPLYHARRVLFRLLAERGGVPEAELYQVFNMGIGMTVIVD